MKTLIRKNYYKQWVAESQVMISNNLALEFRTSKLSNGQLVSSASVGKIEKGFRSHTLFQDYHVNMIVSQPSRVTEKVVMAQHQAIDFEWIIAEACKFYNVAEVSCDVI